MVICKAFILQNLSTVGCEGFEADHNLAMKSGSPGSKQPGSQVENHSLGPGQPSWSNFSPSWSPRNLPSGIREIVLGQDINNKNPCSYENVCRQFIVFLLYGKTNLTPPPSLQGQDLIPSTSLTMLPPLPILWGP